MNLESSKNLGGIGAILMFIGLIPIPGGQPFLGIIALVGLILVLVALHGFADYYKESGITNNSIYGLVAGIVGIVIAGAVIVYLFFYTSILTDFLHKIFPTWDGKWSTLSGLTPTTSNLKTSDVLPIVGSVLLVLFILWIFAIIAAFFARRSLKTLSAKTSVGLFSTAALLLLIGAFLSIILIGFLLMWIAILLIAIAFYQIKPQPEQPVATMAPPPPTPTRV
ncbi:MAG: DUF996 domain-containing protein [Candidatus Bathyarchaeia archaeon]